MEKLVLTAENIMTAVGKASDFLTENGIVLDAVIDRICTGTYISGLQMELVDISASLDLLDNEKLHAKG